MNRAEKAISPQVMEFWKDFVAYLLPDTPKDNLTTADVVQIIAQADPEHLQAIRGRLEDFKAYLEDYAAEYLEEQAAEVTARPAWSRRLCEAFAVAFETEEFPDEAFNAFGDAMVEIYDECRSAVGMAFEARNFLPVALAHAHKVDASRQTPGKAWMKPAGEQARERFAFVGKALAEVIEDDATPAFIRRRLEDAAERIAAGDLLTFSKLAADYLKGDFASACEQDADQ